MPSIPTLLLTAAKRRRRVPEAPVITGITSQTVGTLSVAFTAPDDPTQGSSPVTNYEYSVNNGSTWEVRSPASPNSPLVISGLNLGQSYTVRIRAVNEAGPGIQSNAVTATALGYNQATGGTTSTVSNYLGTGETWRVHTFTSGGTLNVTSSALPFRVLVLGAGSNGNGSSGNCCDPALRVAGSGGQGGSSVRNDSYSLANGAITVSVGGSNNQASSLGNLLSSSGSAGGSGGAAGGSNQSGSNGSPGFSTDITGSITRYAGGGGGGGNDASFQDAGKSGGSGADGGGSGGGGGADCCTGFDGGSGGSPGAANTGGGGGGGGVVSDNDAANRTVTGKPGGSGGSGIVIVAYRIG